MRILKKVIKPNHFNLAYFDNWDNHVHWNIYPRFKSDSDWGNPPSIPGKDDVYKPKYLTPEENNIFIQELKKLNGKVRPNEMQNVRMGQALREVL